MTRSAFSALVLSILMLSACAFAKSGEFMDFQGLSNLQAVGNFYDGGGFASTPNYGVSFSSNFFALKSAFNGGAGDFTPTLLGTPAIFINAPTGSMATGLMNVSSGFSTGINFFYTAGFTGGQSETVTVWSGANGTGTVLATIILGNNNSLCATPAYCTWSNIGATFQGTADSVTFNGPANELGITDITLGSSVTAIPELSSMYLLGTGVLAISLGKALKIFSSLRS